MNETIIIDNATGVYLVIAVIVAVLAAIDEGRFFDKYIRGNSGKIIRMPSENSNEPAKKTIEHGAKRFSEIEKMLYGDFDAYIKICKYNLISARLSPCPVYKTRMCMLSKLICDYAELYKLIIKSPENYTKIFEDVNNLEQLKLYLDSGNNKGRAVNEVYEYFEGLR